MKKFVSFLLLAAMLLSMSVVAMAEGETSQEIFTLVKHDDLPDHFTYVNGIERNISPETVLNEFGMLYNEDYCFILELQIQNFSSSEGRAACFSVSASKTGVKALVATYVYESSQKVMLLGTRLKSSGRTGSTSTNNPVNVSVQGQEFLWYNALNNTVASTDKTLKLFIAVDPRTVTEATELTVTAIERDTIWLEDETTRNDYNDIASCSIQLPAYTPEQTNTQITVGEGENAQTYTTLEAAVAADSTTTNTTFTVPAATEIAGVMVPANSTVTVTASESSGDVTVKEMNYSSDNVSGTVYVITNGDETTAVRDMKFTHGKFDGGTGGDDISAYIKVADVLNNAITQNTIDIDSITSMELHLENQQQDVTLPEAVQNVDTVKNTTWDKIAEVHPVLKITTVTGDQTEVKEYTVSNEDLKNDYKFMVSIGGLDSTKTYNVFHYSNDGNLVDTFENLAPDNLGMVFVELSTFSPLLVKATGNAASTNTEVIFYTMQGDFGNSYEFNVRLKVPDSSYVPSLNLGGFRALSASTPAEYAGSKVVAYTVSEESLNGAYYYNYQIKLFAKFLNTPIYFTVTHNNEAVAISPISGDTGFMKHLELEGTNYYGYSMADYVGLVSGSYPSYGTMYSYIRDYANSVLANFPDKVSGT